MNGYERRKQRSRESILRSAIELFRSGGIRKVSVAQIAKKSGVDPVTIYNNFGDKEELVREAMEALMRSHWELSREVLESEGSFADRLKRLIELKRELASGASNELFAGAMQDDPRIAEMARVHYVDEVLPALDAFIKAGKAEGAVRSDLSASTLRAYIELLLEAGRSHPELFSNRGGMASLTEDIWKLFLHGICVTQPGEGKKKRGGK